MTREKLAVSDKAIFSAKENAFNEEAPTSQVATIDLDISSYKPQAPAEPHQDSLYHKTKKNGFDPLRLNPIVRKKYEDSMRWVKGRFLNHECPSGQIEFHVGPWGEMETHTMVDTGVYTVRQFVADHLNQNCRVARYSDTPVEISQGRKQYVPIVNGGTQRFNFIIESYV